MNTYPKQKLSITPGWQIVRNEFYDIDPSDKAPQEDKYLLIYTEQTLLWIKKGDYHIDLGWYGYEAKEAGYQAYLYRGEEWRKCQLLEAHRSTKKNDIVEKLNNWITAVDNLDYDNLKGYLIDHEDENNNNEMVDHSFYSVLESQK